MSVPRVEGDPSQVFRLQVLQIDALDAAVLTGRAGSGTFRDASAPRQVATEVIGRGDEPIFTDVGNRSLVVFDRGDEITVQAGEEGIRFLLVSGRPIEEPVAWYGPIVMNTEAELRQAFAELREGTFLR